MNESERVSPNYQKFNDDHLSITIVDRNPDSFNVITGKGGSFIQNSSSILIEDESPSHKWLLRQMQALQLNPNVCRRVLRDMNIDENQNKEQNLQIAIEKALEFQEKHKDKFSDDDSLRENGSFKLNTIPDKLRKSSSLNLKDIIRGNDNRMSFEEQQKKSIEFRNSSEIKNSQEKNEYVKSAVIKKGQEFECSICLVEYPLNDIRDFCGANHKFCRHCIESYLIENLRILTFGKPCQCMESSCRIIIKEEKYLSYLSAQSHERFKKLKQINDLNKDPNIRWCPRPGCESYMRKTGNDSKLICKCGQELCFSCRAVWHEGLTCNQNLDQEMANYRKNIKLKNCPKCNFGIEKNDGCNHMTCTNCLYEFCWLCDKKYTGLTHYSWWNLKGCPGMLMAQRREFNYGAICRGCLLELVLYICFILFIIISLALAPVFLFFCACCTPLYLFLNYSPRPCSCKNSIICLLLMILGILISPFTMFFGLLFAIYLLIGKCVK